MAKISFFSDNSLLSEFSFFAFAIGKKYSDSLEYCQADGVFTRTDILGPWVWKKGRRYVKMDERAAQAGAWMMEKDAKPVAKRVKKRFLLYLWMLPQNLLGCLVLFICKKNKTYLERFEECDVYAIKSKRLSGGSLGKYIILNSSIIPDKDIYREAVKHEYGHFRQGKIFGIFFLFVIGIPSLLNNLIARKNKKIFDHYYQRFPEKWADKLGRVIR